MPVSGQESDEGTGCRWVSEMADGWVSLNGRRRRWRCNAQCNTRRNAQAQRHAALQKQLKKPAKPAGKHMHTRATQPNPTQPWAGDSRWWVRGTRSGSKPIHAGHDKPATGPLTSGQHRRMFSTYSMGYASVAMAVGLCGREGRGNPFASGSDWRRGGRDVAAAAAAGCQSLVGFRSLFFLGLQVSGGVT